MSTITTLTNSAGAFQINAIDVITVPVDGQFNLGIPPATVGIITDTYAIAPGEQSTVLPTWVAGDETADPVVAPNADYAEFLEAGLLTVTTS